MIKILIADDHQILIDGVKTTLANVKDIQIVAEANNGVQVLEKLKEVDVDVVLMDINMPEMDGLECCKQVRKQFPKTRVIALSQYNEKRFVKRMIQNGASGYVLKDTDKDELTEAIQKVNSDEIFLSKKLSFDKLGGVINNKSRNTRLFPKLSNREHQVLKLICQEYNTQEIADALFLSHYTVEGHRTSLLNKSGAKNIVGLVKWAIVNELVD
jgi:DNA-binding NarL/FixJ family response regulator